MHWSLFRACFIRRCEHVLSDNKFILGVAGVAGAAGATLYSFYRSGHPIDWWTALVMAAWAILSSLILISFLAARDVVAQELRDWNEWKPRIEGSERPRRPSASKPYLAASSLIVFLVVIGWAILRVGPANETPAPPAIAQPNPPPKPFNPIPSSEQARMEIAKITPISPTTKHYASLNIRVNNLGKLTAIGFINRTTVFGAPRTIAQSEVDAYRDLNTSTFPKENLDILAKDETEYFPNDQKTTFFTVPGEDGDVAKLLTNSFYGFASGSKQLVYMFVSMVYRDRSMADQVYGVTETCVYFYQTFEASHSCGNRAILKHGAELIAHDGNVWPYADPK